MICICPMLLSNLKGPTSRCLVGHWTTQDENNFEIMSRSTACRKKYACQSVLWYQADLLTCPRHDDNPPRWSEHRLILFQRFLLYIFALTSPALLSKQGVIKGAIKDSESALWLKKGPTAFPDLPGRSDRVPRSSSRLRQQQQLRQTQRSQPPHGSVFGMAP